MDIFSDPQVDETTAPNAGSDSSSSQTAKDNPLLSFDPLASTGDSKEAKGTDGAKKSSAADGVDLMQQIASWGNQNQKEKDADEKKTEEQKKEASPSTEPSKVMVDHSDRDAEDALDALQEQINEEAKTGGV